MLNKVVFKEKQQDRIQFGYSLPGRNDEKVKEKNMVFIFKLHIEFLKLSNAAMKQQLQSNIFVYFPKA